MLEAGNLEAENADEDFLCLCISYSLARRCLSGARDFFPRATALPRIRHGAGFYSDCDTGWSMTLASGGGECVQGMVVME